MEFDLTPAQRQRRAELAEAVRERLGGAPPSTPDGHFTRERWRAAADLGLTGLCLPVEHGGGGLGAVDTALCLETFGQACPDTGLAFGVAAHLLACCVAIRDFGTPETAAELLPGLANGELIAANAITEDSAGSDVGGLAMKGVATAEGYRLTGEKSFSSNAPLADVFVVYAVTDPADGFLGTTGFVVPRGTEGLSVGPPMVKLGLHGCPAGRLTLADAEVGPHHVLGEPGQGGMIFQHSMGWERACLFAIYLGLMEAQLKRCVTHARRRQQFGKRIGEFQAVAHPIAEMRQRLESARLLLYRACWLMDQGRTDVTAVSLAKLAVSEAAVANSLTAMRVFAGSGYLAETGIEAQLRDSVPSTTFSGTSEIHRTIVARGMGL
ncbi:acyl-CoA dehydrogenase family protein [Amycolatopsis sp. 195334CR]|uniref:acyl-CoA dehydrogenase family protein n=1 Tax=Amycolatopsis sp. 195334CR TaxID=2814588 RepID=UPI001A8CF4F5|nr:acyl-CoA dehydrogenase family protein [Amycolatopsis sp. 195334CR]MBN6039758.1 acyl-CoA dehydrogenase family protein [Amycolatopsis sp. 195334CR]